MKQYCIAVQQKHASIQQKVLAQQTKEGCDRGNEVGKFTTSKTGKDFCGQR